MKVIIPTYGRPDLISTHKFFNSRLFEVIVLVHSKDQKRLYLNGPARHETIVVTDVKTGPGGLTRQREWGLKNLCDKDEWILFADDNVVNFGVIEEPWYSSKELPSKDDWEGEVPWNAHWHRQTSKTASPERLDEVFNRSILFAEKKKARIVGFTLNNNPLFNRKKWKIGGYIIGKSMLWKNDPAYKWNHNITMEDFYNSAQHYVQYGMSLTNQFICPLAGHYQSGGLGTYDERVPHRLKDVQALLKLFPGFFRIKDREGFVENTDLAVRVRSNTIDKWRASYLSTKE